MHLKTGVALDLVEGRLSKDEETFWKHHIENCSDCSDDVTRWRELEIDLKRTHLRSAPQHGLDNVVRLANPQFVEVRSTNAYVRAEIVFDSFVESGKPGVRGSDSAARQIVIRADQFDVHIKIWGDNGQKQMIGQVLPTNGNDFVGGGRFHLLLDGERIESAVTDEIGEFVFAHVPEGVLSIQIELPDITVIGALNFPDAD
jgi:hypothetical protein